MNEKNTEVKNTEAPAEENTPAKASKSNNPPAPLEYLLWTDGQGFLKPRTVGTKEPVMYTTNLAEAEKWDNLARVRKMAESMNLIFGETNFRIVKLLTDM